jgi:hypothetical protein
MVDREKWNIVWVLFEEFARNIPLHFEERHIQQYQQFILDLTCATGLFLNEFRIPPSEIKQREPDSGPLVFVSTRSKTGSYCDTEFARMKIEALRRYLLSWEIENRKGQPVTENKDYWSMSDKEIEYLGLKYHIPTIKNAYLDRAGIIDALVKRDAALRAADSNSGSSINVGTMIGSAIQQSSPGAVMHHNFRQNDIDLTRLLEQVGDFQKNAELSPLAKSQLTADVETIEKQLTSPHPNGSVIAELLRSVKSICESTIGSIIAPHIVHEISKYVG